MAAGYAGSLQGSSGRPGLPCSLGRAQQDKALALAHSVRGCLGATGSFPQLPVRQGTVSRAILRGTAAQRKKTKALALPRANLCFSFTSRLLPSKYGALWELDPQQFQSYLEGNKSSPPSRLLTSWCALNTYVQPLTLVHSKAWISDSDKTRKCFTHESEYGDKVSSSRQQECAGLLISLAFPEMLLPSFTCRRLAQWGKSSCRRKTLGMIWHLFFSLSYKDYMI